MHSPVLVFVHPADETALFRLCRLQLPSRVAQVADETLAANHLWQSLQSPNVRCKAHVDLLDLEVSVLGAKPDVGGRDEVDAAADARAVNGGDHGLAALFQVGELRLPVLDVPEIRHFKGLYSKVALNDAFHISNF
jgi:hypothetical protein